MNLYTALKFDGTHICKSPPTEVAHFDVLSSDPSRRYFSGGLEIAVNIARNETQASPGAPPGNDIPSAEEQQVGAGTSLGQANEIYVVHLDLSESTRHGKVS